MAALFDFEGDRSFFVLKAFWADHVERGCRCAEDCPRLELHERQDAEGFGSIETSKGYKVILSAADANELLSDAEYYSDAVQFMGREYLGLQSSARATARRLMEYQPLTTFVSGG